MSDLIVAINQEIDVRERDLAALRGMLRAAEHLGGATPPPEPEPVRVPRAASAAKPKPKPRLAAVPSSESARDRQAKVLHLVMTRGPISPAEIREATGYTETSLGRALKDLLAQGRVTATGTRSSRRYSVADKPAPHTEHGARTAAGQQRNREAVTQRQERVVLRERVRKAIAADPDSLTEDRLALALGVDRDLIADATGYLLARNEVGLNPDGTYRRRVTLNGAPA